MSDKQQPKREPFLVGPEWLMALIVVGVLLSGTSCRFVGCNGGCKYEWNWPPDNAPTEPADHEPQPPTTTDGREAGEKGARGES